VKSETEITALRRSSFSSPRRPATHLFVRAARCSTAGKRSCSRARSIRYARGQGWLRASHRKLDAELSRSYRPWHTHDEKQPLTPGAAVELDIEIWPTCIVVPAGLPYRADRPRQGLRNTQARRRRFPT